MGKSSLCLDNGPVRKTPFIATHSLESRTKIELPLTCGNMKAMEPHMPRHLGVWLSRRNVGSYSLTIKMKWTMERETVGPKA